MSKKDYVGLFYEDLNEKGEIMWYRLHYTHARTYEEALDKLLPRLTQDMGMYGRDVKYLLLWKDRKGKVFNIVNVTKAVKYKLKKIWERRIDA